MDYVSDNVAPTKLARLFRQVDPEELPTFDTVAHLDKANNLVRINRDLFPYLTDHQKSQVYRMQDTIIEAEQFGWHY